MASYFNFSSCKESFNKLTNGVKNLPTNIVNKITDTYILNFTKNIWDLKNADNLDLNNLKVIEQIINDCIVDGNKIKRIKFNLYQPTDVSTTPILNNLSKFVNNAKYNTDQYIRYYKNNPVTKLSNLQLLLLTTNIKPIHFYLDNTLNELYQSMFQFAKLLDCFIEIKGAPNFFEEYCVKIGISGLQIIDIEIILGLLTNLLLIDLVDELKNKYNSKGRITELNNIFDLIFKWNYIETSALFSNRFIANVAGYFTNKIDMASIFKKLLYTINKEYHKECMKLYESGKMSMSIFIAYFIKSLKTIIPVLSFSHLGYLDDLVETTIKNTFAQHGGVGVIKLVGTIGLLKDMGFFTIIKMISSLANKPILSCIRTLYKNNTIDISKNQTFAQLYNTYINDDETIIINIILQKKYNYLAELISTFSFGKNIMIADKMLISNVCKQPSSLKNFKKPNQKFSPYTAESQLLVPPRGVRVMDSRSSIGVYDKSAPHGTKEDFKLDAISHSYDIALSILNMPSISETSVLGIDMLYILFAENKSIFKIYDTFIKNFFKCDEYTVESEFEYFSKLLINFVNNLSKTSVVAVRKKMISFVLIQNLYLLYSKYYLSKDANNKSYHNAMFIDICKIIVNVIEKQDKDEINELILACLGMPNNLLATEKTNLLSILVNYNYVIYREYVALMELVTLQKALLFKKILHPAINTSQTANPIPSQTANPIPSQTANPIPSQTANPIPSQTATATPTTTNSDTNKLTVNNQKSKSGNSWTTWFTNLMRSAPPEEIAASTEEVVAEVVNKTDEEINTTVAESVEEIKEEIPNMTLNETIIINKEKVELFFQKLFEYNLYVSFPIIENKLHFTIVNNIMHSVEIDNILNHLLNKDTHLLFETNKQKSKIRFLGYY
jgi:hypothetical protein